MLLGVDNVLKPATVQIADLAIMYSLSELYKRVLWALRGGKPGYPSILKMAKW